MASPQRMMEEPKFPQFVYTGRAAIGQGLDNGTIVKGPIVISNRNSRLSFLYYKFDDAADEEVTISVGWRNRAMNGDIVALHLLHRSLYRVWTRDLEEYLAEKGRPMKLPAHMPKMRHNNGASARGNDRGPPPHMCYLRLGELMQSNIYPDLEKILLQDYPDLTQHQGLPDKFLQPVGAVVGMIEEKHNRRAYGRIEKIPNNTTFLQLLPFDRRIPKVDIHKSSPLLQGFSDDPDSFTKNVYVARITEWRERSVQSAKGNLIELTGEKTDIETMTTVNVVQHGIEYDDQFEELLDVEQYEHTWTIPEEEYGKRRDFTDECVFTVDPASAVDLDDALSCKQIGEDLYEVSVHIVDAAYFIEEGSDLDECAKNRATTVYKTLDTAYPMLPESLCQKRCSLEPHQSRLTVSLVWRMDGEGNIKPGSEWIGRGVIKSCVRLNYYQAQDLIDDKNDNWDSEHTPKFLENFSMNDVKTGVTLLNKIATNLRNKRHADGMIQFVRKEFDFELDSSGRPTGVKVLSDITDSQQMVEEFMAITNVTVAVKLSKGLPRHALLKRQPVPGKERLEDLQSQAKTMGLEIDTSNTHSIQRSLDRYKEKSVDEKSEGRYLVVTQMCQRKLMQKAEYFCAGMYDDAEMYRHFALNTPVYTHFTSPLRKFADLTVHRQLLAVLGCARAFMGEPNAVQNLIQVLKEKESNANNIEADFKDMYMAAWLMNCGTQTERAVISAVHDRSVEVIFMRFGHSQRISIDAKRLELAKPLEYDDRQVSPTLTLHWYGGLTQTLRALDLLDCEFTPSDSLNNFYVNVKRPSY